MAIIPTTSVSLSKGDVQCKYISCQSGHVRVHQQIQECQKKSSLK